MVEKVFISPNRVRAYGNIMNMKTGDDFTLVNSELTVTTDTVDGAEMTVFQFEVEDGISIALVSSASTCTVGDNVLLTATVTDDSAPVEAAEVTFKLGETVLGTDETDASGVATYTYAASTAGSFSFTASYQTITSSAVSVSVNHSYSLAFSQSSYVASGGSATLELTLLDNNVAVSGATVTVTGSDGSVYNGITNSQGIASVSVSVSAETIFTATYSNVSDTCTVTVASYIYYNAMTTDDGNWTKSNSTGITVTYGSNGCTVLGTTSSDRYYSLNTSNLNLPSSFAVEYTVTDYVLGVYSSTSEFVVYNTRLPIEGTQLKLLTVENNSLIASMPVPSTPFLVRVEVTSSTINTYINNTLLGSASPNASYQNIHFKTYKNRSISVKDITIETL